MSKEFTVPLMRGCVVWIQFNGSFVFSFGAGEIVIVVVENASERGMRLGQSVVERQGFQRSVPRFRQGRSEEHTSELQLRVDLVCRLLLEKKKKKKEKQIKEYEVKKIKSNVERNKRKTETKK